ncbi:MAG: diguanylate cyclase [Rhodoplanes sp.]|uniref:diguanylate cyclase domain-containing protein n=1 Tax=Rhodoplanes sp. TaxID=1968906 RepID=UPI0017C21843|nr:diguanylate cyclase [Rhodoplanes sp.]NVO14756.1 diguanylate cyclase [Rhodoplanes sp.]
MNARLPVRCLCQPATALGLLTIALLWVIIGYHLGLERDQLQAMAFQNTRNIARVVEEHFVRSVAEPDQILRLARAAYLLDPAGFDLRAFAHGATMSGGVALQLSLVGPDGMLLATSGQASGPVDLSDRRHVRVHLDGDDDTLFVSEPVLGRVSGKRSIQLSRPVRDRDGILLGVLVASLDAEYFSRFYRSIDLGAGGAIVLVGTDGVVRAGAGAGTPLVGRSFREWATLRRLDEAPSGSLVVRSPRDGVTRLVSYRKVDGLPLAVYAAVSTVEAFADNAWYVKVYSVIAAVLTLVILAAIALAVRQRLALERTAAALLASEAAARRSSQELAVTLQTISQGIVTIDRDGRIAVFNRRAVELLGVPEAFLAERPHFSEVLAEMRRRGEFGSAGELANADLVAFGHAARRDGATAMFERIRTNGQTIEICCVSMPDGGMVRTYTDVTERRASERRIAYMALHDSLTGLPNRAMFQDHMEEALKRLHERGARFAVLSIDLDRFKEVNDLHGHPVGDELLRRVSERLRSCLRDGDLAARLGGDEFAVVATRTDVNGELDAMVRGLLQSVAEPYRIDGRTVEIGASIGIALAPEDGDGLETLLRKADQAMYRVKAGGRNGLCWAGRAMRSFGGARGARDDAA